MTFPRIFLFEVLWGDLPFLLGIYLLIFAWRRKPQRQWTWKQIFWGINITIWGIIWINYRFPTVSKNGVLVNPYSHFFDLLIPVGIYAGIYLLISGLIAKWRRKPQQWTWKRFVWGINLTILGIILICHSWHVMMGPRSSDPDRFMLFSKFLDLLIPAGIYLLVSSPIVSLIATLRGRRIGTEPHCKKCNYILLHLQSPRCPECGTEISPQNTIIGERQHRWHWRWKRTFTGILFILIGGLPMVDTVRNLPWDRLQPANMLLADADSTSSWVVRRDALEELKRREVAKTLPESIRQKLVERALQEQVACYENTSRLASERPTVSELCFRRWDLMEYLSEAFMDGRLTQSEADRFLDQAIRMTLTVRPVITEGDEISFTLRCDQNTQRHKDLRSIGDFWYELDLENLSCKLNGELAHPTTETKFRSGEYKLPASPVGKHTLELNAIGTIWLGKYGNQTASRKITTRTYTVKADYEIVLRGQAPQFELSPTPELRTKVQAAVILQSLSLKNRSYLEAELLLKNLPCDVSFDVLVKTDQEEVKFGQFSYPRDKGKSLGFRTDWSSIIPRPTELPPIGSLPPKVTVLLRPNVEFAKTRPELTAIYSGEIEFTDVPVK